MEDRRGNNGCTEEKPTHPSLRPPPHGYPPYEAPTSWILLDLHAYIADRENATSAWSKMSNGKAIRVTFCTAPPPLVSYICVWCPDADIAMEPTIEAAEADLVLLRVSLRGRRHQGDYFVYKAAGSNGQPSLHLLQDPKPCLPERYNFTLLPHRNTGGYPHAEGDDGDYYIAALNQFRGSGPGDFKLHLFDSMNGKWSSVPVSLGDVYCHITSKVIALGGSGLVAFVDPWRGIIVCDVLGRKPARYLQLPSPLVRLDKFRDDPHLSRDIAFVDGRLTVVELSPIVDEQGRIADYWSWQISSWSRVVSDHWEEDWQMDCITQSHSISIDSDTDGADLLLNQQHSDGTRQPTTLGKLYIAHPTLSLSDHGVVYIMGKVNRRDKKALVLAIDMRISKLQGVAMFDAERMLGVTFSYTYTQSWISGCFDVASGGSSFSLPAHG